jgi:hypothetical protein
MTEEEMRVFSHFVGIVKKVQTISTGDGAFRITIDIPETSREAVKKLMDVQGTEVLGFAVAKSQKKENS